jgi:hypothetical protein
VCEFELLLRKRAARPKNGSQSAKRRGRWVGAPPPLRCPLARVVRSGIQARPGNIFCGPVGLLGLLTALFAEENEFELAERIAEVARRGHVGGCWRRWGRLSARRPLLDRAPATQERTQRLLVARQARFFATTADDLAANAIFNRRHSGVVCLAHHQMAQGGSDAGRGVS